MGCFHSPPYPILFLVINSYSLAVKEWHCWPSATHLTEGGTMACSRCGTLGSVPSAFICTLYGNFNSRHTASNSATWEQHCLVRNNLSFWASFGWSCLLYCNDAKCIKGDEHFMCLRRRDLQIYSWFVFKNQSKASSRQNSLKKIHLYLGILEENLNVPVMFP